MQVIISKLQAVRGSTKYFLIYWQALLNDLLHTKHEYGSLVNAMPIRLNHLHKYRNVILIAIPIEYFAYHSHSKVQLEK